MTLHGHTKIQLTDVHTGQVETIEKDNIVTNAMAEIFRPLSWHSGSAGILNTSAVRPLLHQLYGGLVLYDKALGSDPDLLFAPKDANVVGTAGYDFYNNGTDTICGSWNNVESSVSEYEKSAKLVFDFDTQQANGTIRSVCLSSRYAARYADNYQRPGSTAYNPSYMDHVLYTGSHQLSDRFLKQYKIGSYGDSSDGRLLELDEANDTLLYAALDTDNSVVTLRTYPAFLKTVPLFWNGSGKPLPLSEKKIELSEKILEKYRWVCNYDFERRKLYIISGSSEIKSGAAFQVHEIDVEAQSAKVYNLTNQTGVKLYFHSTSDGCSTSGMVYDGWVYMSTEGVTSSNKEAHYFRIRLTDPGEIVEIERQECVWGGYVNDVHDGWLFGLNQHCPFSYNTETNRMERVDYGTYKTRENGYQERVIPVRGRRLTGCIWASDNLSSQEGYCLGFRPNYLATINDLSEPVQKTPDKTMKITYTLTGE